MKTKRVARRALLTSVLALVLCVSMLVGTTFAWFTDSVTSSNNIIKSGTLDVTMQWKDATTTGAQQSYVDASTGAIFNYDLWEPGYVDAKNIQIANVGTLALKYQLNILANGTVSQLADVIDVYFAEGEKTLADRSMTGLTRVGTLTEVLAGMPSNVSGNLEAKDTDTVTIALKMQESAGNEYQGLSIGSDFTVQLLATQLVHEKDSFGDDYDALAAFPYEAAGKLEEGQSAVELQIRDENDTKVGSAVVPAGAVDENAEKIQLVINKSDYEANITVEAGLETTAFDVTFIGLKENNDVPVKVALRIEAGLDPETVKLYHYDNEIACSYNPETGYVTFESATFSPFTVVYDAESEYIPPVTDENDFPNATVVESPEYVGVALPWGNYGQWSPTDGLDAELEAAYTFTCNETFEQAKENPYANWYCDFYVMLDTALAENQIFLGGNYGSFGWVGFHNGELTLDANTEIPLLGSVTTNPWTYLDVVQNVGTFICGVGDVDDALEGSTFTVMLRLTNPENEADFINVATINYQF